MHIKKIVVMLLVFAFMISLANITPFAEDNNENMDYNDIKVYYYNGFNSDDDLKNLDATGLASTNASKTPMTVSIPDGSGYFEIATGPNGRGSDGPHVMFTDSEINFSKEPVLPDLVFEYKIKYNISGSGYFGCWQTVNKNKTKNVYIKGSDVFADNHASEPKIATITPSEWNTVTVVYYGSDEKRDIYINGELVASKEGTGFDGVTENLYYVSKVFCYDMIPYLPNVNSYIHFDYLRLDELQESFDVCAESNGFDPKAFFLKFNSSVYNIMPEMINADGYEVEDISLYNEKEQIYKITMDKPLAPSTEYTISVDGVTDTLGRVINKDINFTTREPVFYVGNVNVSFNNQELTELVSGELDLNAEFCNEFNEEKCAAIIASQYDENGYFLTEDYICEKIISDKSTTFSKNFAGNEDALKLSAFAWKSEDEPIPVSDIKFYNFADTEEIKMTYALPEYTGEAETSAEIKEDYSGIRVCVNTNEDNSERIIGLLVKYNGETVYVYNAKTVNGKTEFNIPLEKTKVGEYAVYAGIEKSGKAIHVADIDYYSPAYINTMISENINDENAGYEEIDEFIGVLGDYLNMDTESLNKLDDKSIAYRKLLNLRNAKENKEYSSSDEIVKDFAVAVKMALIYEGKNTSEILNSGEEIGIDENTLKVIKNIISDSAIDYIGEQLKGKDYKLPQEMYDDLKNYIILGGVYKAAQYKTVRSLLYEYGEEIGVNMRDYYNLKYPENVERQIVGKEYKSLEELVLAVNKAISAQSANESKQPAKVSGGGGGGGISSGIKYQPVNKEENGSKSETDKNTQNKVSYNDVLNTDWFFSDVMWASEKGIFIGTGNGNFSPRKNLTWEQTIIILSRMGFNELTDRGAEEIKRGDFAEILYKNLADKTKYTGIESWIEETKFFVGNENADLMFDKCLSRAECCTVLRRIEGK